MAQVVLPLEVLEALGPAASVGGEKINNVRCGYALPEVSFPLLSDAVAIPPGIDLGTAEVFEKTLRGIEIAIEHAGITIECDRLKELPTEGKRWISLFIVIG
jgi:hypothetical protein